MRFIERKNIIPFLAMTVLIIGSISTLYVHANQSLQTVNADSIIINDDPFQLQQLFTTYSNTTIETDDGIKTGIVLSEIITSLNLNCPSCHRYLIKASDGYQQTVDWNDMQQGILSNEKRVYFPHLAHAFWVRDVTEIEVQNR